MKVETTIMFSTNNGECELRSILERNGYKLLLAPQDECVMARASSLQPDLIVLNESPTDSSGLDTCRQLKHHTKTRDIPVIVVARDVDHNHILEGFSAGCADFVTHPVTHLDFLARVKRHARSGRQLRRLKRENRYLRRRMKQRSFAATTLKSLLDRNGFTSQRKQECSRPTKDHVAMNRYVAGITHDLNNLLLAIIGNVDIAALRVDHNCHAHPYLRRINSAIDRAMELVLRLTTYCTNTADRFVDIRISDVIDDVMWYMQPTFPEHIEVSMDIAPDTGAICGDPVQIHRLIVNLCTNAIRAMKNSSGELTISVRNREITLDDEKRIMAGQYVMLSVGDTGVGIDERIISRIFDPYFTTHADEGGAGMGLAIVHEVVSGHHASIDVTSTRNRGTTFDIFLPRSFR